MTTFTMQDLSNAVPTTHEQDEEFKQMENIGLKEMFTDMGQDLTQQPTTTKEQWMEYGMNNPISASAIDYATQPSGEIPHNIGDIINNICSQLQLLTSVITSSQAQTKTGENSLQECVSLTLQQADWFKEMVRGIVDDTYDFADYAENAVEHVVEKEVEHYFDSSFDPTDHFDFVDAVSDAVDDRIDDVVSDKIDDAVDAYLTNATISISK